MPLPRTRSRRSLSIHEREEISRGLVACLSLRQIATQLGRAPSMISREVGRNSDRSKYRAANADERAWRSACRPRGRIVDAVSIRERPAEVKDRAIPGHWEGDLLAGGKNSHIATLVERQSRFVMLVKVPGKDTGSVVTALVRQVKHLPAGLMSSLTWDRGTERADHKRFSIATDVSVYFCDPQSPWQHGSNENTNGLLRQYFPKGTGLFGYSQKDLDAVARQLNTRRRKTLGFTTQRLSSHRPLRRPLEHTAAYFAKEST